VLTEARFDEARANPRTLTRRKLDNLIHRVVPARAIHGYSLLSDAALAAIEARLDHPLDVAFLGPDAAENKADRLVQIIESSRTKLDPVALFYVVSYDALRPHESALIASGARTLIVDESHVIRNVATKRTQAVLRLARCCKHVLCLSGTPAMARPHELWPQIASVAPWLFPAESDFLRRFCGLQETALSHVTGASVRVDTSEPQLLRPTFLVELQAILRATCLVQRSPAQLLDDLPPRHRLLVEIDTAPIAGLGQALFDARQALSCGADPVASDKDKDATLEAISKAYSMTSLAKAKATLQYVRDTLVAHPEAKLIVFAHHTEFLASLRAALSAPRGQSPGVGTVLIDGALASEARAAAVDQFQSDPKIRVALLSIRAAGAGITLTAASIVIVAEFAWSAGELLQSEGRAFRIGQTRALSVRYLYAARTLDEEMLRMIMRKQRTTSRMFGSGETELLSFDTVPQGLAAAMLHSTSRRTSQPSQSSQTAN
jgi:SWI/SNF-related matrix-associated actin-dependent regulator 1 of chromatin subfamily A